MSRCKHIPNIFFLCSTKICGKTYDKLLYNLPNPKSQQRLKETEDLQSYRCQTHTRHTFHTSADKLGATSKSQTIIASASRHSGVATSATHRKSILNIVYNTTSSQKMRPTQRHVAEQMADSLQKSHHK